MRLHYLVRDRDRVYGAAVKRRLRAMGIRDKPIAPASPWQNGFAERLIGSIRRECVDHFVVLGEAHLRRMLRTYADYYNNIRTHRSLNKDAPVSRRPTKDRCGSARTDPADERRKSAVGSAAHPWRAAQARLRGRSVECREVYGQAMWTAVPGMAHLLA